LTLLAFAHPGLGIGQDSQDWPFLRGPKFDGHAPPVKLVTDWPLEGPPVLWTRALGTGYSGFTAIDGRVFTQYQTLAGQYVICLEGDTGETVWEHRYEGPHEYGGLYPGPRATPTLGRGHVYFSAPSGKVGCLDANTGKRIWSFNVFEHFEVEPVEFGYSCSPVLLDDRIYLFVGRPDATLVALEADTGNVLWKSGDEAISHVPPFPITWKGKRLIIGYLQNALMAFDQGNGRVLWKKALSNGYDEHAAWPIYREPYLWISAPFRAGSELLELTDEEPGYRTVWKRKDLSNDVCSSVLVGDAVYGFDLRDVQSKVQRPSRGVFRCQDFLTGKDHWLNGSVNHRRGFEEETQDDLRDESGHLPIGHASVIVADGTLILFNDLGELILAKATTEGYEEYDRVRVLGGEICWTQPTLSRGRLYVRNQSRAVCLVLSDPDGPEHPVTGPTLRIKDIPQSAYNDWAEWLLPIEPEYAMDAPTLPQLRRWYLMSLIGFAVAASLTLAAISMARWIRKQIPVGPSRLRWIFPIVLFAYGALGTTLLSLHLGEFLFTWPLCLFVLFQITVYQSRSKGSQPAHPWFERFCLLAFLCGSLGYYLLCRRLSLAFEWVFLAGFPAAVPFLLLARRQAASRRFPLLQEGALLLLAYSAFYALSGWLLLWKYSPTM
jgi:hypothetical protein